MKLLEWIKKFYCRIGWHSYPVGFDDIRNNPDDPAQFLVYAKCKWCGYEGSVDSQGNLF